MSCPGAGTCTAVGASSDSHGSSAWPITASETSGSWGTAQTLSPPANAGSEPEEFFSTLDCPASNACAATGRYRNSSGNSWPLITSEENGVWSANGVTLPGDAAAYQGFLNPLSGLDCVSAGNCTAAGFYLDNNNHTHSIVVTETNGVWGNADTVALPADAAAASDTDLVSVSCAAADACEAVGYYRDNTGKDQILAVTETGGVWGTGQKVAAPPGADEAELYSVSCPLPSECGAGGVYADSTGQLYAMVDSKTSGAWTPASAIPPPSDADLTTTTEVTSVSCLAVGSCDAVGNYSDNSSTQLLSLSSDNGAWSSATGILLPTGGLALDTGSEHMSCPATHHCVVTSRYYDNSWNDGVLVATETTGTPPAQHSLTVLKAGTGSGTVSSSPSGVNCGATCSHSFDDGTEITLTATPASGSIFGGWSSGWCSGTGTCRVTVNADTTVTATFTASEGGGGTGGGSGGGSGNGTLPNTVLGSHPPAKLTTKSAKAKVKFKFSSGTPGATFKCKLDKEAFKPCQSPKTYKVKPGKHVFTVEAIDAAGADATPTTYRFKIVRRR